MTDKKILCVDIGNTDISCVIFQGDAAGEKKRFPTHGSDSVSKLQQYCDSVSPHEVALCSVVPEFTSVLKSSCSFFSADTCFEVRKDCVSGLTASSVPPEIGCDILCNLAIAHSSFPDDYVMVCDCGTAFTTETVSPDGDILGVTIAPGLVTSIKALNLSTSQINDVLPEVPVSVFGRNTADSVNSGVFFGLIGQIKEMVYLVKKEIGCKNSGRELKLILTGGTHSVVERLIEYPHFSDPYLTHKGIYFLYKLNRKMFTHSL